MRQCHGWETEAQPWGVCSRGLTKSKSPRWGSLEGAEVLGDCCARPWFVTWPNAVAVPRAAGVSPDGTRPPWAECCRSQERHLLTCESPRLREGGCAAPCDPISRRFFFSRSNSPSARGGSFSFSFVSRLYVANKHDRSVPGVQQNGLLSCRSRAGFLVTLSPGGSGHMVSGAHLEETRSGVLCEGWLRGGLALGSCGGKGSAWDGLTLPAAARGGRPASCMPRCINTTWR